MDVTLFALNVRDEAAATLVPGVRVVVNGLLGDPYGREQLPRLLEEVGPDVVLLHHDLYLYSVLEEALTAFRSTRPHVSVVVYCPVEWASTRPGNVQTLAGADVVVTYTQFGARAVASAFAARPDAPELQVMRDRGIDVRAGARELGISDKVLTTTEDDAPPRLPDETLNLVYNAADAGLNTATGEGWGLVAFERGATGAAQVMPDHSACAELWGGKALLVPVEEGRDEDGIVSRDGAVAALERLYADPALRAGLGDAARAHALDPRFDWDTIAQSWKRVLTKAAELVRSS